MTLKIGIIGLPNVGKSLLFNKLTNCKVLSKNFFFSTINPNIDYLRIYNKYLIKLINIINTKKIYNKNIIIVDLAGLIKNSNKGQGLGLKILTKIQELDIIIHVIKVFNKDNIYNYYNNNILNNINIIKKELILRDIYLIKKNIINNKNINEIIKYKKYLNILKKNIYINKYYKYNNNNNLLSNLITMKPMLLLFNINKNNFSQKKKILKILKKDINNLSLGYYFLDIKKDNKKYYNFIDYIYKFFNIKYCFTIKNNKIKIWLINNTNIYDFSKQIHNYIYNNYILANIINYKDFIIYKNINLLKKKRLIFLKKKTYIINNRDIIYIKYKIN